MDVAKTLIRSVVRAFYDTPFVLVIDALMIHSAFVQTHQRCVIGAEWLYRLPNEDLAFLLMIPGKELRKLCGKLKEDRLLSVYVSCLLRAGLF